MQRCCRAIVKRTLRETDTPEEVRRKEMVIPLIVAVYPFMPLWLLLARDHIIRARGIGNMITGSAVSLGLWYTLLRRSLPMNVISTVVCMLAVGIIVADVGAAAELQTVRPWTWIVLIMDMCLAVNVGNHPQWFILGLTCVWTAVYTVENAYRLGLYDIEEFSKPIGRLKVCDCAAPPCARGAPELAQMFIAVIVLCGDYYATRGFATGLRVEQAKVQTSVEVAEQVAGSLAGFDLEAAGSAMRQAGADLPPQLADSFRRLLRNLASYRPYLPQSCFEEDEGSESASGKQSGSESVASSASSQGPIGAGPGQRRDTGAEHPCAPSHRRESAWTSATSSSSGLSSPRSRPGDSHGAPAPRRGARAPQSRRVALLTCNRTGLISTPRLDADSVSAWLAEEVELFVSAVKSQGGVTDSVSGDHCSAHFGAVKAQGSHCIAATRAASSFAASGCGAGQLQGLPRTGAVCCGRALCGDFGSSACQRFMVIGGVSAFIPAAERAAAAWGISTLIDSDVHNDVEQFWCCRLRKLVKFPKRGPRPNGLWELLAERMREGEADEWMYELENTAPNPWEPYNAVIRKWCEGGAEAALSDVAKGLDQADAASAEEVAAALLGARELMQKQVPPPLGDFSAAVFAGDAAPLRPLGQQLA